MEVIWNLYLKVRNCTVKEAQMLGSLVLKDKQLALKSETIKELEVTKRFLEQEVAVYKEVLDKIKSMVLDKNENS